MTTDAPILQLVIPVEHPGSQSLPSSPAGRAFSHFAASIHLILESAIQSSPPDGIKGVNIKFRKPEILPQDRSLVVTAFFQADPNPPGFTFDQEAFMKAVSGLVESYRAFTLEMARAWKNK